MSRIRASRAWAHIPLPAAAGPQRGLFTRPPLMDVWAASSSGRGKTKRYLRSCESLYQHKHFLFSWVNASKEKRRVTRAVCAELSEKGDPASGTVLRFRPRAGAPPAGLPRGPRGLSRARGAASCDSAPRPRARAPCTSHVRPRAEVSGLIFGPFVTARLVLLSGYQAAAPAGPAIVSCARRF